MESIISALCTPNEILIRNTNFIFLAIEAVVSMLLFTTVLNLEANVRTKVGYVVTVAFLLSIFQFFFPTISFLSTLIIFICIYAFFRSGIMKTLLCEFIPYVFTIVLENLYCVLTQLIFNVSLNNYVNIPITIFSIRLITYFIEFAIFLLIKKFNLNIKLLNTINKSSKTILLSNLFIGIIFMVLQISVLKNYGIHIPSYLGIIVILAVISYFIISIYSLAKTTNLELANQRIENLELYNKTLNLLHDNIRAFKHDFNNIIQAIGRIRCY